MPKLENFSSKIKIDGVPYSKNTCNYQISSQDTVSIYHKSDLNVVNKTIARFEDWTDLNDVPYTSLTQLTDDLDLFLFYISGDYAIEVSRGNIPGQRNVSVDAFSTTINDSVFEDVWNVADENLVYPAAAGTWEIVSSDASDTGDVSIDTLDGNYIEQTTVITLNGVTPVTLPLLHFRPDEMKIIAPFPTTSNVGIITLSEVSTGNKMGQIPINAGRSFSSHYSVPAAKSLFSKGFTIYIGKGDDAFLRFVLFEDGGPEITGAPIRVYQQAVEVPVLSPLVIPEKTNVRFQAVSTKATIKVSILGEFRLIDN